MTLDRQMVVAVIDDDAGMRTSTRHLLSAYGYGTETFDSASAFLDVAATSEAVCLVVDIQLGAISGLELARHLTMEGYTYPVIFMTGFPNEAVQARANSLGCIAFLEKPFPKELLLDAVKKAIGKNQ
jgi:FixJ family two-component response regulator